MSTQETHPLIGKNVAVRTVTMIYTGRAEGFFGKDLILSSCSWIPETEQWSLFVSASQVRECEPYPDDALVYVNRELISDWVELTTPLPRGRA